MKVPEAPLLRHGNAPMRFRFRKGVTMWRGAWGVAAAETVKQARNGRPMTTAKCRKWAKSTRGYSFNRCG